MGNDDVQILDQFDGNADKSRAGRTGPDVGPEASEVTWSVVDVLGRGGYIDEALDDYEMRQPQIDLASKIDWGMENHKHIVAEGATGVGKSFAYLLSGIRHAVQNGSRLVVCTANIALQEQLVVKDIPFLQSILPTEFKFMLVKGLSNYFCKRAMWSCRDEFSQGTFGNAEPSGDKPMEDFYPSMPEELVRLCKWGQTTETGDKSELDFEPDHRNWAMVSSSSEDCHGDKCRFIGECFGKRARREMNSAHVIVSNYHFLFASISLRMTTGQDVLLPPFDYLVCDEAHKVADIARSFFGWEISAPRVNRLIVSYRKRIRQAEGMMDPNAVGSALVAHESALQAFDAFNESMKMRYGNEKSALRVKTEGYIPIYALAMAVKAMSEGLREAVRHLEKESKVECSKLKLQADKLHDQLLEFGNISDPNGVYYLERFGKSGSMRVCKRTLDVSGLLWNEMIQKTVCTVATSATMAIAGDCNYVKKEMGMMESVDVISGSPFDFRKQALVILSAKAPDPQDRNSYPEKVSVIMEEIIRQARGRTLGLFTSYRVLRHVADYVRSKELGYQILVQGEAPRMELVRQFKSDISSVLFGTDSFWAGVDVKGEALSCLVIDKIPFPSPGDPVLDALQEACGGFGESFFKISVPRAVLQFRQGAGRLIRSASDRGVLVVLDRRLVTKGYGDLFCRSLPPMRRADGIRRGEIRGWLDGPTE